jgi:hypothetical protein
LYRLKQSGREWFKTLRDYVEKRGFIRNRKNECMYTHPTKEILIGIYVDDIAVTCNSEETAHWFSKLINKKFETTPIEEAHYILGIRTLQTEDEITLDQARKIETAVERFGLQKANPQRTPAALGRLDDDNTEPFHDKTLYQSIVGTLLYLEGTTRPDISESVQFLSSKNSAPTIGDYSKAKRVLCYLKGTRDLGIAFKKGKGIINLTAWTDADWANNTKDRKSQSGHIIMAEGVGPISWKTKKQEIIASSSTESEYIALATTIKEIHYVKDLFEECGEPVKTPTIVSVDNQSTIVIAENTVITRKSKHYDLKLYFVKESVENGDINLIYVCSEDNTADMFTKPLSPDKFEEHRDKIMS